MTDTETSAEKGREPSEQEIQDAIRRHFNEGRPEVGYRIRALVVNGDPIPYELLDTAGVKAEKVVEGVVEVPPRGGKGSGEKAWKAFAKKVSDLDEAVVDSMSRDEIIEILEAKGIISPEGDDDTEES